MLCTAHIIWPTRIFSLNYEYCSLKKQLLKLIFYVYIYWPLGFMARHISFLLAMTAQFASGIQEVGSVSELSRGTNKPLMILPSIHQVCIGMTYPSAAFISYPVPRKLTMFCQFSLKSVEKCLKRNLISLQINYSRIILESSEVQNTQTFIVSNTHSEFRTISSLVVHFADRLLIS